MNRKRDRLSLSQARAQYNWSEGGLVRQSFSALGLTGLKRAADGMFLISQRVVLG